MARPTNPTDPEETFAAGKRGVQTLYRALASDDPRIQLAAARIVDQAVKHLPEAIDAQLRDEREAGTIARASDARLRS